MKQDRKGKDQTLERNKFFRIKVWGSRGSLPAPFIPGALEKHILQILEEYGQWAKGKKKAANPLDFVAQLPRHQFGGYGGNTPCVEVISEQQQLIIDGGSGIRPLGYDMMEGRAGRGGAEVHILFTHFHWDHLIGLPFFTPIFIPGNRIHVYSVQPELEGIFENLFRKPFFPVPLSKLGASIVYHRLEPRKSIRFNDLVVTPYELDHPDPCWGYRIEKEGRVYSHCVDTECTRVTREALGPDLPLYQGVDLMLFDAQYTLMETIEKVNWGHAAATLGLDIAMREGVKKVVFMHHDPASSNEKIAAAESQARKYYNSQITRALAEGLPLHKVDWTFGHEGMIVDV